MKVEGLAENTRALDSFAADITDLPDAMQAIAAEGARLASSFAPRRTGRLAGSLRPEVSAGRAAVVSALPYAAPINYGWRARNIRASSFLARADRALGERAEQLLDEGLDTAARKAGLTVG